MSSQSKYNSLFQRIMSYIRKGMKLEERYDFEKDMQTDPFLQDAMDGFDMLRFDQLSNDVEELEERLAGKVSRKRQIAPYLRIAAGVVIILSIGTILYLMVDNMGGDVVSEHVEENDLTTKPIEKTNYRLHEADAESESETVVAEDLEEAVEEKVEENELEVQEDEKGNRADDLIKDEKKVNVESEEYKSLQENSIAAVEIEQSASKGNGTQDMVMDNAEPAAEATSISDGYISEANDKKRGELFSYNEKSKRETGIDKVASAPMKSAAEPALIQAQPTDGYKAYKKYIRKNKTIDDGGKTSVKIQIVVKADGSIGNVTVKSEVDAKYGQEAIRLIKQGPKWQPQKTGDESQQGVVEYEIKF